MRDSECRLPALAAQDSKLTTQNRSKSAARICADPCHTKKLYPGGNRGAGGLFLVLGFAVGLLAGLADVDAALEEGAVLNGDALGNDIAGQGTLVADVHPVAGHQVAAHLAGDYDFASVDVGIDDAVAADGGTVAGQIDGAFHAAVNVE